MDLRICKYDSPTKLVTLVEFQSDHVPMTGERIHLKGDLQGEYRIVGRHMILDVRKPTPTIKFEAKPVVKDKTMVLIVEADEGGKFHG